jgi:mannose-6-phosphate isomerase-like protein (cupin superfamily)
LSVEHGHPASDQSANSARVARLDEGEAISVAGGLYQPLRRLLGVRAFGLNAFFARAAGDQLIEQHNEAGAGSGHHEEAYIVLAGRAAFSVGDEKIDAPAGTVVFVPDISASRGAVATEPGTAAIVVGGAADRPLPTSPFEYWFVAEGPYSEGDYQGAIEIALKGLEQWPDHPTLHYQLACYHALAAQAEEALDHLEQAIKGDSRTREWAQTDEDFDTLRDDARFRALTG